MPEQKQVQKKEAEKPDVPKAEAKDIKKKGEELKDDMDSILDEIDEVLQENAEQFVKDFVQRGGE